MNNKKIKKIHIVNTHCHFMTFDHLPDEYTRRLVKLVKGFDLNFLSEKFIKRILGSKFISFINPFKFLFNTNIIMGMRDNLTWDNNHFPKNNGAIDNYIHNGEYIIKKIKKRSFISKKMTIDSLCYKSLKVCRPCEDSKNDKQLYELVTPLMMDMITATNIYTINDNDGVIEYTNQIKRYSNSILKYPFKVYPFIMFNPIRKNSFNLVKDAIKKQGFIGIKMYPAMGFYANPDRNTFKNCIWKKNCPNRIECSLEKESICCSCLKKLYKFADDNKLPITVHTQYESMQNIDLVSNKASEFTDVLDFVEILKHYKNIRVNFAHFGGVEFIENIKYRNKSNRKGKQYNHSVKCRNDISYLIDRFNTTDITRVFTDTAANKIKSPKNRKKYFEILYRLLQKKLYNNAIMFGTDTPAISIFISDKKYCKTFIRGLNNQYKKNKYSNEIENNFFFNNAITFLFGRNREIPKYYLDFIINKFNKDAVIDIPKLVKVY